MTQLRNLAALLVAALAAAVAVAPAEAQSRRLARSASEVVVINARKATLTEFQLTSDDGTVVGGIKAPLAPGKRLTLKLAKGAPCLLTVLALYDDEFENAGSQIDACKDKTVRFAE